MVLLSNQELLISFPTGCSENSGRKILIIGGGPNGIYAALLLLQADPTAIVHVVDCRKASRPQVIRLPFSIIDIVPEVIKSRLWPDERIRDSIFSAKSRSNASFWPRCDYKYFPFIQIGEFTKVIREFLEINFSTNFKYTIYEKFDVEHFRGSLKRYDLAIISAGNGRFNKILRKTLKIDKITTDDSYRDDVERHGVYLLFKTPTKELYERDEIFIRGSNVAPRGITYAHSNDSKNHLQIYTYPVGEFREIFLKMPKSFMSTAAFRSSKSCLSLAGSNCLSKEEQNWLSTYRNAIKGVISSLQIPHPSDDEIKVYYASRSEYFYDVSAAELEGIPVLFIGDSSGGTDYKFGLSLGRGLITTMNLVQEMQKRANLVFDGIIDYLNIYWMKVIASEFSKNDPAMTRQPDVLFKYVMEGRTVDGELLKKEAFIKELKEIEKLGGNGIPVAGFK